MSSEVLMVERKRKVLLCFLSLICFGLITGCGNTKPATSANLSYTQTNIRNISVSSNVQIVGLGEASHGVAQYQQMKADVFRALVKNNGCHTFIIEGDFGGSLKVDQYINGGAGTAEEAIAEIGFGIYHTKEMANLVNWMRSYNKTVSAKEALHFYGMDVQRFDNNKEYLFSVIGETHPKLSLKYSKLLARLTDKNRNSLDKSTLKHEKKIISELIEKLNDIEPAIVNRSGQSAFDFAKECAKTIESYCELQLSDDYNASRDKMMYEKIEWFLQHGDHTVLFINGHNGHIAKESFAGYTGLGELLSKHLDKGYYSIGTDAVTTKFNSQKDNGAFEVLKVKNTNDLNSQFTNKMVKPYFIDFESAATNEKWQHILNSKQSITTLNVGLSGIQKLFKSGYTVKITPKEAFDAMIIFKSVTPSTILSN